jgi:hypothetical protein
MIKYTRLIICCLLTLVTTAGNTGAQTSTEESTADAKQNEVKKLRHEVAVYGAGGMSALNYSLDKGGSKTDGENSISGIAGIGYTWNINESVGIVTGIEATTYGAKTSYDLAKADREYGVGIDKFKFMYTIGNYVEEQDIVMLLIPVMAQYSVPLSDKIRFYLAGGGKVGFSMQAQATVFSNSVNTSGHYYYENQTYTDLPKYGFVSERNPKSTVVDIDTKALVTASIETGARFVLHEKILLYTGAYLDYGLNNIRSVKDRHLINYQEFNPSVLKFGSVLNTAFVNNVKVLGVGLKVRLSFGW